MDTPDEYTNVDLEGRAPTYSLGNVFYSFNLRSIAFDGRFDPCFERHLIDTTPGASAFEADFHVFVIFHRNQGNIAAIGIQKRTNFLEGFLNIFN
jgi:hypothetical protein